MSRILVSILCACWSVSFMLLAADLADWTAGAPPAVPSPLSLAVLCSAIAASLFAWAVTASLFAQGRVSDIVGGAGAFAMVVGTTMLLASSTSTTTQLLAFVGIQGGGLGVTFLLSREADDESETSAVGSRDFARRMAVAAAHGSMLAKLARSVRGEA